MILYKAWWNVLFFLFVCLFSLLYMNFHADDLASVSVFATIMVCFCLRILYCVKFKLIIWE